MGLIYEATDSYAVGLMLLAGVALAAFVYVWFVLRLRSAERTPGGADRGESA
jgi:NNP family nitrate/nitrite transporter-like MFS transporter